MAVSAFEVQAVFALKDEASVALKSLSDQVKVFTKLVQDAKAELASFGTSVTGLNRRFAGLNKTAEQTKTVFTDIFAGADKSIAATIGEVSTLQKAWVSVGQEAKAAAAEMTAAMKGVNFAGALPKPSGAGKAFGPKGGSGSFFGINPSMHSRMPTPLPHTYVYPHGNPASLATAAGLLYGAWENIKVEDLIADALVTGQVKLDKDITERQAFDQMYDLVQKGASMGGFAQAEVGEAVLQTERQFGGLPFAERMKTLETLLPYAEGEARLKHATLPESFEALVGLTHMSGVFKPEDMPENMRAFAFASTVTPASIQRFRTALSYSLPILDSGFDMDPKALMFMTAMMQTAGISNTKSGTWIRTFFQRLTVDDSSKVGKARTAELRDLGFLDKDDNAPTWWMNEGGQHVTDSHKVDWMKSLIDLSQKMHTWLQSLPAEDRLNKLKFLFGERGGGAAAMQNLTQFVDQFPVLAQKLKIFQGGGDVLSDLSRLSPLQDARKTWADLTNVLMDITRYALPPLVGGLQTLSDMLKSLHNILPKPKSGTFWDTVSKDVAKDASLGAAAGFTTGLVTAPFTFGTGIAPSTAIGGLTGGVLGFGHGVWDYFTGNTEKAGDAAKDASQGLTEAGKAATDFANRWGAISTIPGTHDLSPEKLKQDYTTPKLEKQSFNSETGTQPLLQKAMWQGPPPNGQPIYITSKLDIDGRTLAASVAQEIAGMLAYPAQAPFADGRQAWWPPDSQINTT